MLLLGGGRWGSLGITIFPLGNPPIENQTQGKDYNDFIAEITKDGWSYHPLSGQWEITNWYLQIERAISGINPDILLGHSMGGHLSMMYMEDHPNALKKTILFNVPLICQSPDGLKTCYERAGLIRTRTYLIMSKNDDVLAKFGVDEIKKATDYVEQHSNVMVRILDVPDKPPKYQHSPFPPQSVALDILKEAAGT
jgi:pimeloyl-ACP methyl ester carboxylesterase